uniref:Subtilisin-like protease n=1 Tax=Leersia perrieri TaxID=77586 RepID=A0A0D9W1W8_9ORYZ
MLRFSRQCLFLTFLLHLLLQSPCSSYALKQNEPSRKIYIIYLGEREHDDADVVTDSHHDMLATVLGSKEEALESIVYSYRHSFSGFAARLTKAQASEIRGLPNVVSVRENQIHRLHTSRSWDFLGMDYKQPNGLLAKAKYGDGIIIGVVDSGITPESASFTDDGYGPTPSKWKGICQVGPSFDANSCNRKLIGARWYIDDDTQDSMSKIEILSPRDVHGHGTHTASTAGGNVVHNASIFGLGAGTVRGGAPRARVAIYKACWNTPKDQAGCSGAGVLKAMDDAVHDGVDVLSLSIGGPLDDAGTLHVVASGITLVYSAGNDGPIAQTVENSSPWLLTVAAATTDRSFPVVITLGNNQEFVAQSLVRTWQSESQFSEIQAYHGADCDADNIDSNVKGKIVFCFLGKFNPAADFYRITNATAANGGKGVILPQYKTDLFLSDLLFTLKIPFIPVDYEITYKIYQYLMENDVPKAKISLPKTMIGSEDSAPKVAVFSSRGPSYIYPGVIKPDIAAPGVSILAASPKTAKYESVPYHFSSGTSMSCPHVSGIIAVLKSLHPGWSPAALKSAIMTTATTFDNKGMPIQANGNVPKIADPFDYGAGFVNPNLAADPGLIYDISGSDYFKFFNCMGGLAAGDNCTTERGSLADLNLPSIAIPNLRTFQAATRTVTNVGQVNAVYKAFLQAPAGVEMAVEPSVLVFSREKKVQSFKVTFKATRRVQGDYRFGSLAWHDGGSHWVRIPIAVRILYIVYLGERQHEDADLVTASHHDILTSILGRHGFSGFSAMLTQSQAREIAGITPESLSFDDAGYGPPPSKWKGICQVGPSFGTNSCNRKIIGARWYAYDVPNKTVKQEILSPRDVDGHGTHTASTAGGNIVHNVSLFGLAAGTVHGGAPRARCDANNIDSTVKGKIVFCFLTKLNPAVDFYNISKIVGDNGGTGVILSQYNTDSLLQDVLLTLKTPFVPVDYEIAYKIYQYIITSDDTPKAKISLTRTTTGSEVSAPKVAAFSSRGPSSIYPGVLKPDIAAPGVSILAAAPKTAFYSSAPYHFASGTSMSCPHVSGIIAVLKSLHPEWSPAALKSAIMTTATTFDNNGMPIQANGYIPKIADPFDYGAGFVNPTMAADPGLIYDINPSDYLKFFNCIGGLGSKDNCTTEKGSVTDLNLPSIAIPNLRTSETAVRTVTNVGDQHDAVYKAFFETPAGVEMTVEPSVLVFSNEKKVQSFKVTFKATCKVQGDYTFGSLAWHDGGSHWVRIPIAVRVVIDEIYSKIS